MTRIRDQRPGSDSDTRSRWRLGRRAALLLTALPVLAMFAVPASSAYGLGLSHVSSKPSAANIGLGMTITDTATVTGRPSSFVFDLTPKGKVQFFVCGPTTHGCSIFSGKALGKPVDLVPGPDGSHSATATSASYKPTKTGKYCFEAVYNSSDPLAGYFGSVDFSSDGCFTVLPTTDTTVSLIGIVGLAGVSGGVLAYRVRRQNRLRAIAVGAI